MLKHAASVSLSSGGAGGDLEAKKGLRGSFGANMRAEFGGMVQMMSLDEGSDYDHDYEGRGGQETETANNHENKSTRRLVVVGDVHGCIDECEFFLAFHIHVHKYIDDSFNRMFEDVMIHSFFFISSTYTKF